LKREEGRKGVEKGGDRELGMKEQKPSDCSVQSSALKVMKARYCGQRYCSGKQKPGLLHAPFQQQRFWTYADIPAQCMLTPCDIVRCKSF